MHRFSRLRRTLAACEQSAKKNKKVCPLPEKPRWDAHSGTFVPSAYAGESSPFSAATPEDLDYLNTQPLTHHAPARMSDHICVRAVRVQRWLADRCFVDRFAHRAFMLYPVAFVNPIAAVRVDSIRGMWNNAPPRTLRVALSEYENRRLHWTILAEHLQITRRQRFFLGIAQALCVACHYAVYLVSPRLGHRVNAYMAEESTVMLTHLINDIDLGKVADVPIQSRLAKSYWRFNVNGRLIPKSQKIREDEWMTRSAQPVPPPPPPPASDGSNQTGSDAASAVPVTAEQVRPSDNAEVPSPPVNHKTPPFGQQQHHQQELVEDSFRLRDLASLLRAEEMVHRDANHAIADQFASELPTSSSSSAAAPIATTTAAAPNNNTEEKEKEKNSSS